MFWLVVALIGAGTFFVTGFNLLTDPLCVSADFGGGRVVQVTCRTDEFGTVTGLQAGLISIFIGLGLLVLLFWRPLKTIYIQNKLIKIQNSDYNFQKIVEVSQETTIKAVLKKCPKCAEDIKAEAIKCRFCGSDLGPKVIEKSTLLIDSFFKKYLNGKYSFQIMVVALVTLAVLVFGFLNISKTRELNALKESGEICVLFRGGTSSYGCADYPQIKFEFCSEYEFMEWSIRTPDFQSLTEGWSRSQGQRFISGCEKPQFPFYYSFDRKLEENIRVGEYELIGYPYKTLTGDDWLEETDTDLMAKVSLKAAPKNS